MAKHKENKKGEKDSSFFATALSEIIADTPNRSQLIIKARYGVTGKAKTLETIGKENQITRERVRQIIKESIKKAKDKQGGNIFDKVQKKIIFTIKKNSGIIKKDDLLSRLSSDSREQGAIKFFLECIDAAVSEGNKEELEKSVVLSEFRLSSWRKIKNASKGVLADGKEALSENEFFKKILDADIEIDKNQFINYLSVSKEIKKNNFGKWGLAHWSEINPKGTRQKAFLVMKETGQPLHFREIASLIDEYNLSNRKAHPQTVHNELIKDKRFVLVGRGVYALAEWGYKRGTVKDVLGEILKEGGKPMEREEILDKALSMRKVKKSTVMINLNSFFERVGKDKYTFKKEKIKN